MPRMATRKPERITQSSQVRALLAAGMSTADIVKKVGCKPGLVYVLRFKTGLTARAPRAATRRPAARPAPTQAMGGVMTAIAAWEQERLRLREALQRIQQVCATTLQG